MNGRSDRIVKAIREILRQQEFFPGQFSRVEKRNRYLGFSFGTPGRKWRVQGIKWLWLGRISYQELSGIFICAYPTTTNATKRLMNHGFKLQSVPDFGPNCFFKQLISNTNVRRLNSIIAPAERNNLITILLKNSYPFAD